jgi:hypothetical protein
VLACGAHLGHRGIDRTSRVHALPDLDHFGSAFAQLEAATQQYDPGGILTPGYEIF